MITCLALISPLNPLAAYPLFEGKAPTNSHDRAIDEAFERAFGASMKKGDLPGAIGAIIVLGEPTRVGAVGLRKLGSEEAILPTDLVHIGSDTKAMTGVLLGRLVDQGKLRWDSTIKEVLKPIASDLHEDFQSVTLSQLMHMTAGLPEPPINWAAYRGKKIEKRRLMIAKDAMQNAPLNAPGEKFQYSNLSVMIAGAMAEAAGGDDWETLMRREVFDPLGMETASFGVPGIKKKVDQPWGHKALGNKLIPIRSDNDPALGPAGTVHLSMDDWGKFVSIFLADEAEDESKAFLKNATRKMLVTAGRSNYAMGWGVVDGRPWAKGSALQHAGSNTTWYAVAWVAPGRKTAFLIAINGASDKINGLANDGVLELIHLASVSSK